MLAENIKKRMKRKYDFNIMEGLLEVNHIKLWKYFHICLILYDKYSVV